MNIALVVMQALPKIISLVQFVEQVAGQVAQEQQQNPTGSFKLNLVKVLLEDFYNTTNPTVPFNQVWSVAEKIVNVSVTYLHEVGVFKRAAPSSVQAATASAATIA